MRALRIIVVFGAILHLTGGHYGVLQCIAWTRMLVDYSAESGLIDGARKTFDGKHPCCMCKSIAEAKKQDTRQTEKTPSPRTGKLSLKDLKAPGSLALAAPRPRDFRLPGFADPAFLHPRISSDPPTPPPRSV